MIIELKEDSIEELSKQYDKIILDFYAEWCGPCKALSETLENVMSGYESIALVKVNVDEFPETSTKFKIRNLPTLVFLKNNEQIGKTTGFISANTLREEMSKLF